LEREGTVDSSFNILSNATGVVYKIALHPDGRIVLGGNFKIAGRLNIVRLHSDGSLDDGFEPGFGPSGAIAKVSINSAHQIALVGWFRYFNNIESPFFAVLHSEVPLKFARVNTQQIVINGYPGKTMVLEKSQDFEEWQVARNHTFDSYHFDMPAPVERPLFFRARQP
jgi:hypothetical protein